MKGKAGCAKMRQRYGSETKDNHGSELRTEKLQALRESILQGTYEIRPDLIAERIIEEHLRETCGGTVY